MLKALILLIEGMTKENLTRGVQLAARELGYHVLNDENLKPLDRAFGGAIYEKSGRPRLDYIDLMKAALKRYKKLKSKDRVKKN